MPVPSRPFKGHRDSVNTLLCDEREHPNVLASGSDDGTCRLWDLRTTRVSKCFLVKKALGTTDGEESAVNSLAFGKAVAGAESAYIYVAAGNHILTFDIRRPALLVERTDRAIFSSHEDEINTLSRHPGKHGQFLSAPDDAGNIHVYDIEKHQWVKTLKGQHTNICSVAPFRPNAPWDLVSGGLDGCVILWDLVRGRVKGRIDLNSSRTGLEEQASQVVNPPLVHSLAFAPNGKSFVAGLGDATLAVVTYGAKQIVRRLKHHRAMVSQVHFPAFRSEDWLVSVANDAKVCIWDYTAALTENRATSGAYVVTEFALPRSPNAITTTCHQNLILVADLSNEIRAYSMGL